MKLGKPKAKRSATPKPLGEGTKPTAAERVRDVAEGLGPLAADIEAAHIAATKKKKAPPKRG